jgi:8-oxo-dGTP pyrophosphatase MutT (NUDIX family)
MTKERHEQRLEKWARGGKTGTAPVEAATVILLRDTEDGLETLMLRRNSKIAFGGMWVFPGGRVDPEDREGLSADDDFGAARRAAVREAQEEAGMDVDLAELVAFSHWTPPPITPRRFLTWFFIARAPEGDVVIDHGEIRDHAWMRIDEVMRRRDAQEIELAPPTFVSLHTLAEHNSVGEALESLAGLEPERFTTHIAVSETGPVAIWHGDAGYGESDLDVPGPRHRLIMKKPKWEYLRHG